jgi:hypothetical protein
VISFIRTVKYSLLKLTLLLFSCGNEDQVINLAYTASGRVIDEAGAGIRGVKICYNSANLTLPDNPDSFYWGIYSVFG